MSASGHADQEQHIVPLSHYFAVFTALMVFTVLTVWAAEHDFGAWNTPIALAIALAKASMVILIFMHVRYGSRLVMLLVASGAFWLLQLLLGTMTDYLSRGYLGPPSS